MNGQMKLSRPARLAGPYYIADIPKIQIDYRGLVAFAREKGCHVCDLTDDEKNRFIIGADMNYVREQAIRI